MAGHQWTSASHAVPALYNNVEVFTSSGKALYYTAFKEDYILKGFPSFYPVVPLGYILIQT